MSSLTSRKQADQLTPGDCVGLSLPLHFEVLSSDVQGEHVVLEVTPTPCADKNCPNGCQCQYAMFDGHGGPFKLRVEAKKRLEFQGNLEQDEAQIRILAARVKRMRASKNGHSNREPVPTKSMPATS